MEVKFGNSEIEQEGLKDKAVYSLKSLVRCFFCHYIWEKSHFLGHVLIHSCQLPEERLKHLCVRLCSRWSLWVNNTVLPNARHWSMQLTWISLCDPYTNPSMSGHFHSTDEETEAQESEVTRPRCHNQWVTAGICTQAEWLRSVLWWPSQGGYCINR